MSEEIKNSEIKPIPETPKKPDPPQTDFKIAEIWLKSGNISLEASPVFWADKCRTLGILEYCKDIVKDAKAEPEKKILTPDNGKFKHWVNSIKKRF